MQTHARELPGETATAGSGHLTDKGYAAQPAAPLRPRLSRYVQLKCGGALIQPSISFANIYVCIRVVVNVNAPFNDYIPVSDL